MRSFFISLLISAAMLLGTGLSASATPLELVPSATTFNMGDTFDVALNITGITPPGVTVIHADLFFDPTILSLLGTTAGNFFDMNFVATSSTWIDPLNPAQVATGNPVASFITSPVTGPDMIGFDFFETAFSPSTLDGTLVNLTFSAIGIGDAMFSLNDIMVINALGIPTFNGIVTSGVNIGAVPEPGTIILLGVGLISLIGMRRRHQLNAISTG